jgi:hypothetical protein
MHVTMKRMGKGVSLLIWMDTIFQCSLCMYGEEFEGKRVGRGRRRLDINMFLA